MAINKVEYGGNTLIDITDTTATSNSVLDGEVFYNANGTRGVGSLVTPDVQINGTSIVSNDVANIITNTTYDSSSNKIATMSDILTTQSAYNFATRNSTYFNNGTIVWTKIGHIVLVEINNLQVSSAVPDHNALVASGLPTCVGGVNFYIFQHQSTNKARVKIANSGNDGQIQTHYCGGMAVSSNQWYGALWYITSE